MSHALALDSTGAHSRSSRLSHQQLLTFDSLAALVECQSATVARIWENSLRFNRTSLRAPRVVAEEKRRRKNIRKKKAQEKLQSLLSTTSPECVNIEPISPHF